MEIPTFYQGFKKVMNFSDVNFNKKQLLFQTFCHKMCSEQDNFLMLRLTFSGSFPFFKNGNPPEFERGMNFSDVTFDKEQLLYQTFFSKMFPELLKSRLTLNP